MYESDITELNALGLEVPADGTRAIVSHAGRLWLPAGDDRTIRQHKIADPNIAIAALDYLPVHTADGKIIDVVGWTPDDPALWRLRTGHGMVLGADELVRVSWTTLPCYLVATPAAWRRADRARTAAICILDWGLCDTAQLLTVVWGGIICEDRDLADKLAARQREMGGQQLAIEVDRLA